MSAVNLIMDGMDTGRESVILSAIAEAVTWRHAMEQATDPNFKRPGQRVIVYPKSMTKFSECLRRGDYSSELEGGHAFAYERIAAECTTFANCPIFLPEDSLNFGSWPVLAENVSFWMEEAKQVVVSWYKQVLENGPDVCNWESDSDHSDHGEEWADSNMYTKEMLGPDGKKIKGPQQLSPQEVTLLRAVARATQKSVSYTPSSTSC
jgi:hypothetical protein